MRVEFGEWIFDVKEYEQTQMSYSKLMDEQLHTLSIKLDVDADVSEEFDLALKVCQKGGVLVESSDLSIHGCEFGVNVKSTITSTESRYKRYILELNECSNKEIIGLEFANMVFEPYEISQHMSNQAVVINAKMVVTCEQFEKINEIKYCQTDMYFPVVRKGISDTPLQMRFGRNLWSDAKEGYKMAIVLVEQEYDKKDDKLQGFSEPELSIVINQVKQLRATNEYLLDILEHNQLISEQQKMTLQMKLSAEELRQQQYLYDYVKDIDCWR